MKDELDRYSTGASGKERRGLSDVLRGIGTTATGVLQGAGNAFAGLHGALAYGPGGLQQEHLRTQHAQQLAQSAEFQAILNKIKVARAKQEQGIYEGMTDEEKKQHMVDPSGYRNLQRYSGKDQPDLERAKAYLELADKTSDEALAARLSKEAERILFGGDAPANTGTNDDAKPDAVSRADSPVLSPSARKAVGGSSPSMPVDNPARTPQLSMLASMPDNRSLFVDNQPAAAGPSWYAPQGRPQPQQPQPATEAFGLSLGQPIEPTRTAAPGGLFFTTPPSKPATFDDLGLKTPQDRQNFAELEKKVPGLRQQFKADPQGYQELFAALAAGKITVAEAVELITQAMGQTKQ